jgi:hypothetical protein
MGQTSLLMQFLKRLLSAFSRSPGTDNHGSSTASDEAKVETATAVPGYVHPEGSVARFVFSARNLFKDGRPKPGAFQPELHPDLQRYEVSVCGLHGVSTTRLWELGRTIRARDDVVATAAIEVSVAHVNAAGLTCEPAPELPHFVEHGVILGWNPDPAAKSARLDAQNALVASLPSTSVLRPPL